MIKQKFLSLPRIHQGVSHINGDEHWRRETSFLSIRYERKKVMRLIKQKLSIGCRGSIFTSVKPFRRSWRLTDRRVSEREMTSVGRRRKRAGTKVHRRDRVTCAQWDFKLIVIPRRPWSSGSPFLDQRTPSRIERAIFDDL